MSFDENKTLKKWDLTIEKVSNGFVVHTKDDVMVVEEDELCEEDCDPEATQRLLWVVMNYFDLMGSRYDKRRVCVKIEKGDKHEG